MGTTPEYDRNQLTAWKSWQSVASAVVYFNDPQPALASPITRFIPSEPFPRLIDIFEFCAEQKDWCAVLNGDIVILNHFQSVEKKLKARNACAASSWRWEFDPEVGFFPNAVVDPGVDFFAATPKIWQQVYQDIDENLRLGSVQWDSFLLGWFAVKAVHSPTEGCFYSITPSRCVLHPKHGNRKYGPNPPPVHFHGWPTMSPCEIK